MCGDCVESCVLSPEDFGEGHSGENETIPGIIQTFFWQEVPDFFGTLGQEDNRLVRQLRRSEETAGPGWPEHALPYVETAFCHLVEANLFSGFQAERFTALRAFFGPGALERFLVAKKKVAGRTIWAALGDPGTYGSHERWQEFVRSALAGDAREIELLLEPYLATCTTEPAAPADHLYSVNV
ncbi:MAG: hypothetical protein GX442_23920 [Candidatus Riflebacteria bacterium]|nr:hypothetical protein [Candidatus Riflebacteria bacterium]